MLNMQEMNAAIEASMSPLVRVWVNWMVIIFLVSILFAWKHTSARVILVAFILTVPVALITWELTHNVYLLGIPHLIVWTPLAVYLIRTEIIGKTRQLKSVYGVYLIMFLVTIITSLVLDIRDIALVSMGLK